MTEKLREKIKNYTDAVIRMHPNIDTEDDKQFEMYKAFHELNNAVEESLSLPQVMNCDHEIISIKNEVITSGYMCVKCNELFKSHCV